MPDLVKLMRAEGLKVVDLRVDPAPGTFTPVGVMFHHTAGHNHRNLVRYGHSRVPGPLCNVYVEKDGTVCIITDGKANDSGRGSSVVLREVKARKLVARDARARGLEDDTHGNQWFYDVEIENMGDGRDPYPKVQVEASVAVGAVLCRLVDGDERVVRYHREWTRRKIDPSLRDPDLRTQVGRYLDGAKPKPAPTGTNTEDYPDMLPYINLSGVTSSSSTWVKGGDVKTLQGLLVARGAAPANTIRPDGSLDGIGGPGTRDAVRRFQKARGLTVDAKVGRNTWTALLDA